MQARLGGWGHQRLGHLWHRHKESILSSCVNLNFGDASLQFFWKCHHLKHQIQSTLKAWAKKPNFSCSSGEKELPPLPLGSVAANCSQFWVHQVIRGTREELAKIEIEILKSSIRGKGVKTGRMKKYNYWGREGGRDLCPIVGAKLNWGALAHRSISRPRKLPQCPPGNLSDQCPPWKSRPAHLTRPSTKTFCQVNFFLARRANHQKFGSHFHICLQMTSCHAIRLNLVK